MRKLIIAATLILTAGQAQAGIVFDNGTPTGAGASGIDPVVTRVDDFVLGTPAIIRSAGVYISNVDNNANWSGQLEYYVYADSGGNPVGSALNTAIITPDILTPVSFPPFAGQQPYLAAFDFVTPFIAAAGVRYWFGVRTPGNGELINWLYTTPNATLDSVRIAGSNLPLGIHDAFYLSDELVGDSVPTPGALALLGVGLLGLGIRRRAA